MAAILILRNFQNPCRNSKQSLYVVIIVIFGQYYVIFWVNWWVNRYRYLTNFTLQLRLLSFLYLYKLKSNIVFDRVTQKDWRDMSNIYSKIDYELKENVLNCNTMKILWKYQASNRIFKSTTHFVWDFVRIIARCKKL